MMLPEQRDKHRGKVVFLPCVVSGVLLFFIVASSSLLLIALQIRRNKILSNALVDYIRSISEAKPNNPIFNLLLQDNGSLIRNIENSHVYSKLVVGLIILFGISFSLSLILLSFSLYKNIKEESADRISSYKLNCSVACVAFFGTAFALVVLIVLPLLLKTPDKLSDLLCSGIDDPSMKNNGLLAVFKKLIHNAFQDEAIVLDLKQSTKKNLLIFTGLSIFACLLFLVSSYRYYPSYITTDDMWVYDPNLINANATIEIS